MREMGDGNAGTAFVLHAINHTFLVVDISHVDLPTKIIPLEGERQDVSAVRFQSWRSAENHLLALGADPAEISKGCGGHAEDQPSCIDDQVKESRLRRSGYLRAQCHAMPPSATSCHMDLPNRLLALQFPPVNVANKLSHMDPRCRFFIAPLPFRMRQPKKACRQGADLRSRLAFCWGNRPINARYKGTETLAPMGRPMSAQANGSANGLGFGTASPSPEGGGLRKPWRRANRPRIRAPLQPTNAIFLSVGLDRCGKLG